MKNSYFKVSLLLLIIIVNLSYGSESACSASKNVRWKQRKGRCVGCKDCPPGQFRNLTEPYTGRKGKYGDEQCLRCRPCPAGTYSENGRGECRPCRVICTDLSREFDEVCSSLHDAKCGSCLSGFEDTIQNTKFPCAPSNKKVSAINEKLPETEDQPLEHVEITASLNSSFRIGNGTQLQSAVRKSFAELSDILIITGAVTLALLAAVLLAVFCVIPGLRRRQRIKDKYVLNETASMIHNISQDNDIEMDVVPQDKGNEYQKYQQTPNYSRSYVRAELGDRHPPRARGELSHQSSENGHQELMPVCLQDFGVFYCERDKDICTCKTQQGCQCRTFICDFTEVCIKHSDKFILLTAENICHKPIELFRNLELECSVIYQENDNRDRDPERISQKELVLKLLNRWIEIKSYNATLQVLSEALCRAKFHHINDKLHVLYKQNIAHVY